MLEKIDLLKKIGIDQKEYDYDEDIIIEKIKEKLQQSNYDISEFIEKEDIYINSLYELLDEYLFFSVDGEDTILKVLNKNLEMAIVAVSYYPEWYTKLNKGIRANTDVILALGENMSKANDVWKISDAFEEALGMMDYSLFEDKESFTKILNINGRFFEFGSDELKNDRELLLIAIQNEFDSAEALDAASDELRNNREVVEEVLNISNQYIFSVGDELKKDPEFAIKMIKIMLNEYEWVFSLEDFDELFSNREFLIRYLDEIYTEDNLESLEFFSDEVKEKIREILELDKYEAELLNSEYELKESEAQILRLEEQNKLIDEIQFLLSDEREEKY